jgi:periplasmic divalent cation tolerance protein
VSRKVKVSSGRVLIVFITTSNRREAVQIAEAAVGKQLAACANVVPSITSIFRWKGRVQKSRETLLMLKTSVRRYRALEQFVHSMHSYEVPEIVAVVVEQGLRPYLGWVRSETATDRVPIATHDPI